MQLKTVLSRMRIAAALSGNIVHGIIVIRNTYLMHENSDVFGGIRRPR